MKKAAFYILPDQQLKTRDLYSYQTGLHDIAQINSSRLDLPRGAPAESKRSLFNINEHCEQGRNKAANQNAKGLYACRLAGKAYSNKLKVYIYTSSIEESEALDTQLWTFNDISFIPHKIHNTTTNATTNLISSMPPPVLIGHCTPPNMYNDILINLTLTLPEFIQNFSHIIEIIPNKENYRQKAREHYKHFQQLNYEVVTHDLNKI